MIWVRKTVYGVRRLPRAGKVIVPCVISTDGGDIWKVGSEEYDLGDCVDNPPDKPQEEPINRKDLSFLTEMLPALPVNPGLQENLRYILHEMMRDSGGYSAERVPVLRVLPCPYPAGVIGLVPNTVAILYHNKRDACGYTTERVLVLHVLSCPFPVSVTRSVSNTDGGIRATLQVWLLSKRSPPKNTEPGYFMARTAIRCCGQWSILRRTPC